MAIVYREKGIEGTGIMLAPSIAEIQAQPNSERLVHLACE
jgi:hypothetical protein